VWFSQCRSSDATVAALASMAVATPVKLTAITVAASPQRYGSLAPVLKSDFRGQLV
jgi:hypothetical protein